MALPAGAVSGFDRGRAPFLQESLVQGANTELVLDFDFTTRGG